MTADSRCAARVAEDEDEVETDRMEDDDGERENEVDEGEAGKDGGRGGVIVIKLLACAA